MKATFNLPDELYRQVKARSALEGRPVREVVISLFQDWLGKPREAPEPEPTDWDAFEPPLAKFVSTPPPDPSLEAARESIAKQYDEPL